MFRTPSPAVGVDSQAKAHHPPPASNTWRVAGNVIHTTCAAHPREGGPVRGAGARLRWCTGAPVRGCVFFFFAGALVRVFCLFFVCVFCVFVVIFVFCVWCDFCVGLPPLDPPSAGPTKISLFFFAAGFVLSGCLLLELWPRFEAVAHPKCAFGFPGVIL